MEAILEFFQKYSQVIRINDFFDIAIITVVLYYLFDWIRETRAMQLVKGILILFIILQLSTWFKLTALNFLLNLVIQVGMFAIVVIFQPELRSLLERVGRSKVGKLMDIATLTTTEEINTDQTIREIVDAAVNMAASKTGALIVIERETRLGDTIKTGTYMDAYISSSLLENIFVVNTPLHDGAVIVRGNKIVAAGCFLPLTANENLSRELGTRHRAALGISENSDAAVVVVSEETGKISLARNGSITRNLKRDTLSKALNKIMSNSDTVPVPLEKIKFWKGNGK